MSTLESINLGIVGACGRGASFKAACDAMPNVRILAVCDTYAEGLPDAAKRLGASEQYTDYEQMLEESDLDAIIIGTPMHYHVPQAIAALDRNLHVLSEVPAGVSVDECRDLVLAARKSRGIYMMAENYTYIRSNAVVREIVKRGIFGTPYFGEAEYIHELKGLNEITTWRRKWQTGINGNTYPTHSLGPILQWMPGDRVVSVACAGSGHHYKDPRGNEYEQEDSILTLCKMQSGGLVKLRLDMLSDRPHAMTNYQLQGTDGCYESSRAWGEPNRIWLRSRCKEANQWLNLKDLEDEFMPEMWRQASEVAQKAGHGGGDYFEVLDFIDAVLGKRPPEIGIDLAMDMSLPGLISQQSIRQGGRWIDVPDTRNWQDESCRPRAQLQMTWPKRLLDKPPSFKVPDGYVLRTYQPSDEQQFRELMIKAGFGEWDSGRIAGTARGILPEGFFVIEHTASRRIVATAEARHGATDQHPYAAELGWVAGDPAHKGKGLGHIVCAAATALMTRRGYEEIYLLTDDWRLPAISTYLKLGYEPLLFSDDMPGRWEKVRAELRKGAREPSR